MNLTPSLLTAALTLPISHLPSPSKRWKEIISLAQNSSYVELISILTRQNLKEEIERLKLDWIKECEQLLSENRCISFFCKDYPHNWKSTLGKHCPASLWWNQKVPPFTYPSISIVGSRQIHPHIEKWTYECASFLSEKGFMIISGGAKGVDQAAALGSLYKKNVPIEILPFGLDKRTYYYSACRFSTCFPQASFSTRNAMFRNQLIYAYSPQTIVVQSSENSGGTWYGAINALQKGLSQIYSWNQSENKGHSSLIQNGAIPFKNLQELILMLRSTTKSATLFSI